MNRKDELIKIIHDNDAKNEPILLPLVDEVMFLETQLTELKKLPFIKIHPSNPELQKATPASKQYKELLQQYTNVIKTLCRCTNANDTGEESPLRKWAKKYVDKI